MAIDSRLIQYLLANKALGMASPYAFSGHIQHFMQGGTVDPGGARPGVDYGTPPASGPVQPRAMPAPGGTVLGQQQAQLAASLAGNASPIEGVQSFNNVPFQSGFQAKTPTSNLQFNPGQYRDTVTGAQGNLNTLAGMLMQQANGGGPNLAAQQERTATDRNIAQAYAMAQSNPNNPANARNVANQAAAANQQAAADSATQRMQQQLSTQQQLQSLGLGQLGTAGSLMTDEQRLQLSQSQGNQNAALAAQGQNLQQTIANQQLASGLAQKGADIAANTAQAAGQAAATAAQMRSSSVSDVPNPDAGGDWTPATPIPDTTGAGAGDITTPTDFGWGARGGLVASLPHYYAAGGAVEDPNQAGALQTYNYAAPSQVADANIANGVPGTSAGPVSAMSMLPPAQKKSPYDSTVSSWLNVIPFIGPVAALTYQGISTALNDPHDSLKQRAAAAGVDLSKYNLKAQGGVIHPLARLLASGGPVPGTPSVPHNDYRNDVVPAMLSPGEDVMPLAVMLARDPAMAAKKFIQHQMATGEVRHFADGGEAQRMDFVPGPDTSDLQPATSTPAPQTYGFESGSALRPAPGSEVTSQATGAPAAYTPAMAQALASQGTPLGSQAPQGSPAPAQPASGPGASSPQEDAILKMVLGATQPKPQGDGSGAGVGDYLQGVKQQQAAIQAKAQLDAQKADLDAAAAQHKAELLTKTQADDLARQNAYNHEFQRQQQQLQDSMAQFSKINTVVDPSRYWDSRSTGQKVLASIGVFLGGLGGGHNEAAASIQDAINRDVDAQKATIQANLAKGREAVSNRTSLISIGREKFQNDLQAEAFAKATMLDAASAQAEAQAARLGNPVAKNQALMLSAALQQEKGKQLQLFSNQAQELALRKSMQNLEMAKTGVELMRGMGQAQGKGAASNAALDLVGNLEAKFKAANTGGMSVASTLPAGIAPKTSDYLASREASKMLLAKALSGSERAPSPESIALAEKFLPTATTSAAEAKHRFAALRSVLASVASGGAGAPDTTGLGDLRQED